MNQKYSPDGSYTSSATNLNSRSFDSMREEFEEPAPRWYDRKLAVQAVRIAAAVGEEHIVLRD